MKFYVYVLEFPNGKKYVGKTKNPTDRWKVKGTRYSSNVRMYQAIKNAGWDNVKKIIKYSDLEEKQACEIEKKLIHEYCTTNIQFGYNRTCGGEKNRNRDKFTPYQRAKCSAAKTGYKNNMYGKHHSDKSKRLMSLLKSPKKREEFFVCVDRAIDKLTEPLPDYTKCMDRLVVPVMMEEGKSTHGY